MKAKYRFKHGVPPNLEVITLVSIQHINPENNIITHLMTSALEQHTQTQNLLKVKSNGSSVSSEQRTQAKAIQEQHKAAVSTHNRHGCHL